MKQAKKNSMINATSHLFSIKGSPYSQSQVIQIIVYYGKRKMLGQIKYQKQKRFIVRKDAKISQFRQCILQKIQGAEGLEKQNMSYQLLYRNKLLVGNNQGRIADLVKMEEKFGDDVSRIQVSMVSVDTF